MKFHPDATHEKRPSLRVVILYTFTLTLILFVVAWGLFGWRPAPTTSIPDATGQPRIGGSLQGFVGRYGPSLQLVENDPASPYAFNDGRVDLTVTLTGQTVHEVSAYNASWTPRDAQRYCLQFLPPGAELTMDDTSTLYISSLGRSMLTITSVECTLDSVA